jgi:membrane protease subunit HflK
VTFDLQYTIDNAYAFVFTMAEPRSVLFETAQAAVRKVIGGMLVDEVLIQRKTEIEVEARKALIATLADYAKDAAVATDDTDGSGGSAFSIDKISLLEVQPPSAVRAAFQEVSSAGQDEERSISRAKGDAQEILERARAEAAELREGSEGYKEAKILEATGEAARFVSLYKEYIRAPEVTRRRLYLETMEAVLPNVDKIIVEPDTVGVMPLLQSGRDLPPPVGIPKASTGTTNTSAPPAVSKEPAQ